MEVLDIDKVRHMEPHACVTCMGRTRPLISFVSATALGATTMEAMDAILNAGLPRAVAG